MQSDFSSAQKRLERLLHKNPSDAYANITLGNIYFASARFDPEVPRPHPPAPPSP